MKTHYVMYYLLIIVFVFALSYVYEFWIEDGLMRYVLNSGFYHSRETTGERFEYVFTVTLFSAIALLFPVILAYRFNLKLYAAEIEKFKLETQLLHADKLSAIGMLTASIAHEFKNPLVVVTHFITNLKNRVSFSEKDAKLASIAEKECHRMINFIEELHDFNRPTTDQLKRIDFHECLNSVLLISDSDLKKKNISIVKDLTDNLPNIPAVRDQVSQVLINLINNATDACEGGGKIKISTTKKGESIELRIQDNGKGINNKNMAHIFEPFFTTKSAEKGTGLGLYVTYGIIKNHGGTIKAESKEGEGTTFIVTFPIRKIDADT